MAQITCNVLSAEWCKAMVSEQFPRASNMLLFYGENIAVSIKMEIKKELRDEDISQRDEREIP